MKSRPLRMVPSMIHSRILISVMMSLFASSLSGEMSLSQAWRIYFSTRSSILSCLISAKMYRLFISTSPSKSGRNRLRPKFFRGSRLTLGACRGTPLFIRSKAKLLSDCLTEVFTLLPRTDLKLGFSLAATKSLSFEKLAERTEWLPLYFNNWFGGGTIFFGSST